MRFFEPTEKFLDWLANYAGDRVVFDVGCGEGHITLALQDRGVKVLGIDPGYAWGYYDYNPRLSNSVIPRQAHEVPVLSHAANTLTLFCRPSHGGFVADTIRHLHPTSEVLYISRPENVVMDLKVEGFKTKVLRTPKCREEKVYQVVRQANRSVA